MGKRTALILAVAVAALFCAGYSNADVLGTIEHSRASRSRVVSPVMSPEMKFSIAYPLPGDRNSISLSWNVTTDDVGKTFFASAETHPSFDIFTFLLTNGRNNPLFLSDSYQIVIGRFLGTTIDNGYISESLPATGYESTLISGIQDGVDFEGYRIDSIALTVNELLLEYDAPLFLKGVIPIGRVNYSYDITYTINGQAIHTPEPATLGLLIMGGLVSLRRRRKLV